MSKKIYAAPTITEHGNAVDETKGLNGRCWEIAGKSVEFRPIDTGLFVARDDDR